MAPTPRHNATATSAVTLSLLAGTGTLGDANGDVFNSVENVIGSGFNDNITGDTNANLLIGGNGNDTLFGGDGNDTLVGGAGSDSLNGGTGFDWLDYTASTAGVAINLLANTATGGDATGDVLATATLEGIIGSALTDTLTGDANANWLNGIAGSTRFTVGPAMTL